MTAARQGGHVVLGTEAVRDAIRHKRAELLLVARDSAGRRNEILRSADQLADRCLVLGDKEELGRLFGRTTLGVLAVLDRPVADELSFAARCAADLAEAEC